MSDGEMATDPVRKRLVADLSLDKVMLQNIVPMMRSWH